jgi:hypothetical protein
MKSFKFILMILLISFLAFSLITCSGGGGDDSGGNSTQTTTSDVAAVGLSTGRFGGMMVNKDGEMLLPIVDRDASGNATQITGALYVNNITGESVLAYFGDDGMPAKAVMGDYILLFSNWSADGKTVDIAKIYTPTNYIEVFKGVTVDANISAKHANLKVSSAITKGTCWPNCPNDAKTLAESFKIGGLLISTVSCAYFSTISLGLAVMPCTGYLLSYASLVLGNERWLNNIKALENIHTVASGFVCGSGDLGTCVSVIGDLAARTLDKLDNVLNYFSNLVSKAQNFLSNPNQPSGVVQQGGGLPSETQMCTSFTYSSWSACVNNTQTRTITSSSPAGCTGGTKILEQTCDNTPSAGNYAETCTITVSPFTCCAGDYCSTYPGTSNIITSSYTVASGESFSQINSDICSQISSVAGVCSSHSCNSTESTSNSASWNFSCSISSSGCSTATETIICNVTKQ